jgi:hypothetical protein
MRTYQDNFSLPVYIVIISCFILFFAALGMQIAYSFFRAPDDFVFNESKFDRLEIQDLQLQEQYWINRIELAQDDSIGLTINLQDSVVTLDLKGIELRTCPVYTYRLSPSLSNMKQHSKFQSFYTSILTLERQQATIPKAPVILREIEVGKPVLEDLSFLNRAFDSTEVVLDLTFNQALHIRFQEPHIYWPEFHSAGLPVQKHYLKFFAYWIEIQLAAHDLRAIYRALPKEARLVLCF